MSSKKNKKKPLSAPDAPVGEKQSYRVHNSLVSYYLCAMFSVFSLFLTRQNYSNARHDKFYLYLVLSGVLVVGAGVAYAIRSAEQNRVRRVEPFLMPLSAADGAFLCFIVFALISTFASAYYPGTWIAEFGRNNGMLLMLFYLAVYLIVTRMYVYKDYVIAVFLITSCVIALLTVLNFFYIDPLGLLEGYKGTRYEADFGSTIGNKNFIASYMAMFLPVALMTLALSKKRYMRVIGGISTGFGYVGALCANSGSVFLGLFIALPAAAIFCAQRYDWLTRYTLGLTILFASGKALRLFSHLLSDTSKGFEQIQHFLIYDGLTYLPIILLGAIALILFLSKNRLMPRYHAKAVTVTLISLTGAAILGVLGVLIRFSVIDTTTPLGKAETLLRFNDRWGTHRGFMWSRALEEYGSFGFFGKLFGAGPDAAYYVLEPHFGDLIRYGDTSTNSVHNEYLNYLITQGALGLISYAALLGAVCVRAVRRARSNPTVLIFLSAVICYAAQASVNIYQPMTTPLFFLFLSMTEALNRRTPLNHA